MMNAPTSLRVRNVQQFGAAAAGLQKKVTMSLETNNNHDDGKLGMGD